MTVINGGKFWIRKVEYDEINVNLIALSRDTLLRTSDNIVFQLKKIKVKLIQR